MVGFSSVLNNSLDPHFHDPFHLQVHAECVVFTNWFSRMLFLRRASSYIIFSTHVGSATSDIVS